MLHLSTIIFKANEMKKQRGFMADECIINDLEESNARSYFDIGVENIILNPRFDDGLNNWSGRSCKLLLYESLGNGKVLPLTGKHFASAIERSETWNGIQQDITHRLQRKLAYEFSAVVRIFGSPAAMANANMQATLYVQTPNGREEYIAIARSQATDMEWVHLQGKIMLNSVASKAVIYVEGPQAGVDILLNTMIVKRAQRLPPALPPSTENVLYGVNIVSNSHLTDGLNYWSPLGPCSLSVKQGSPRILPPMAVDSLSSHEPLNSHYILTTNRTQTWMGPSQILTGNLSLFITYQVSAWVRVSSVKPGPQNINVALGIDNHFVNGGQVEAVDDRWHEVGGSFRIEKQFSKAMVYVQGPIAGIDLMVSGLQIFPVDRKARFKYLKMRTDEVRKRDVILKISKSYCDDVMGSPSVKITQITNSFPVGSCISRADIDNENFVEFFKKNFEWAVFGNELKWYWTEPRQGSFNYAEADELLDFCNINGVQVRGHCIFWEVESSVQLWLQSLGKNSLMAAVQNRLNGLLTRYRGKFNHYDVDNEMLHGSFYQDRLGRDVRALMFKTASQLDPSPLLFVNDYRVEDGTDTRSSPEKYIRQIMELQDQGANVGGIGLQGHIDCPIGPIIYSALDKLGVLGLPVWFTEIDVSSINEFVRADDLEVMLREIYAHPAVDGIMLWGFWELMMSRENASLVNAEGDINEAGKRFLALKQEWLSHACGSVDENGEFLFRGFHGTYAVDVATSGKKITHTFSVEKKNSPLVVQISI